MKYTGQMLASVAVSMLVFSSASRKAYADFPTPIILLRCLPSINLMTLDVIAEWDLSTSVRDANSKTVEDQGVYTDDRFLQHFDKGMFSCKMMRGLEVDVVPTFLGRDNLGLASYNLEVIAGGRKIYSFKSDTGYSDTGSSLSLVVDGNLRRRPLLMACLMQGQTIMNLPQSATCQRSGFGYQDVTLTDGAKDIMSH